jgi:ATP-dependent DNA helicase RecG
MIPLPDHPNLKQGLRTVKGVGPQIEQALAERGFNTLGDLLGLMPNRYQDRRTVVPIAELAPDREVLIRGTVRSVREGRYPKSSRRYFEITLADRSGAIPVLWFSLPAHLRTTIKQGKALTLFGRVSVYKDRMQIVHPELTPVDGRSDGPEIRPVYPEMEGIRPGTLRRIMANARRELKVLPTIFPEQWLKDHHLTDPVKALAVLHDPPADKPGPVPKPEQTRAWRNLALAELLFLQLALARSRHRRSRMSGIAFPEESQLAREFIKKLPFQLTESQIKVFREIRVDMTRPEPMARLLQGDVGSGKTVVAMAAAMICINGGRQAAMMAPTEILARQHYVTLKPIADEMGVGVELLLGGMSEKDKALSRESIASGQPGIVIGTHALISSGLEFKALGLAIIDEQHRFGVAQRLALRQKAENPDLLVMTATPIPRTLAMTLYGDLDMSVIRGVPPGRKPVETRIYGPDERNRAYRRLAEAVKKGGRAYIVAPRIEAVEAEDTAVLDTAAVETLYEFVREKVLPRDRVGLMHGRMKTEEREQVMEGFRSGRLQALVATTVIEVGVDVPEATVMLVEGAERFGLAQLHQLRGRVGRGDQAAQCLLVAGTDSGNTERLKILAKTRDGFELAEADLKMRGPGDPAGVRQSGLPPLKFARLPRDLDLLLKARDLADELATADPELTEPSFKLVREGLDELEKQVASEMTDAG